MSSPSSITRSSRCISWRSARLIASTMFISGMVRLPSLRLLLRQSDLFGVLADRVSPQGLHLAEQLALELLERVAEQVLRMRLLDVESRVDDFVHDHVCTFIQITLAIFVPTSFAFEINPRAYQWVAGHCRVVLRRVAVPSRVVGGRVVAETVRQGFDEGRTFAAPGAFDRVAVGFV